MQFVILAAGSGTRLMPLTANRSKLMLPVANKPFLEWVFDSVSELGEVILVVRHDQKDIIERFGNCKFAYQEKPMGTADAIASCEKHVNGSFVVINGDELIAKDDIERFSMLDGYNIAVAKGRDPGLFGSLSVGNGCVKGIAEKEDAGNALINAGMYMFDEKIFDAIRNTKLSSRGEYEITDALEILIKDGIKIKVFELGSWLTLGYPWDLLDINKAILDKTGSIISDSAEIKPGSCIEEPVAIGDKAIIGPNCYIRKYSTIGSNCKIGNAVEIKNSIIMDNTNAAHLSYVADSVIGSNCNIGAGTIFANLRLDEKNIAMKIKGEKINSGRKKLGAVVGDNVKFGINVSVMPGRKIWPNLLIPPCITIKDDIEEQPELK